ncbi:hypothetical protein AAGS40_14280 [Paraburkholderia sp. PREW-6R]|uniref:hypothetical protein n=1 Tax=Paraburkholderia sp. PREW-6R TaxID=3141544 RepID=UPI0031F5B23F
MKLEKVAERLRRQHAGKLVCDDSLVAAMAERCLARNSGARHVDACLDQRVRPALCRGLLTRMVGDMTSAKIILSSSAEGSLTIDLIDRVAPDSDPTTPEASIA